jgi:hypothetical protein
MRCFLLPWLARMSREGAIEGLAVNVLRMLGQVRTYRGRQIGVGRNGYRLLGTKNARQQRLHDRRSSAVDHQPLVASG